MKIQLRVSEKLHLTWGMWLLLILMLLGALSALARFAFGIGAISNLNNTYPWGFWISFDLFCGVALGSGAFTLAALVHIFELKQFKPLLRPSILTGFLGYLMVIVALLVDLGQPTRIWHMMIYQNHHSVLFEIGICVMSYTTVLAIEFAPVFFEGIRKAKWAHLLHRYAIPFIILGVVLSTLHQSSLGSLLLIESAKLHPLWWSPILPVMFFVSAVGVGLGMIILESSLSARAFKHGLEVNLLSKLAWGEIFVLGFYLLLKFSELAIAKELGFLFNSGLMSIFFWLEILIGAVIPITLFAFHTVRESPRGLLAGSIFVVLGLILNRFNVSWFGIQRIDPMTYVPGFMNQITYIPNLPEVAVSVGIVSAGVFAFTLAAKYLPLFSEAEVHEPEETLSRPPEKAYAGD